MRFIGELVKIGKNYYGSCNGALIKLDNSRPNKLVQTSNRKLAGEFYGEYLRAKEIRQLGEKVYELFNIGESYKRLTRKEIKQFIKLRRTQ